MVFAETSLIPVALDLRDRATELCGACNRNAYLLHCLLFGHPTTSDLIPITLPSIKQYLQHLGFVLFAKGLRCIVPIHRIGYYMPPTAVLSLEQNTLRYLIIVDVQSK